MKSKLLILMSGTTLLTSPGFSSYNIPVKSTSRGRPQRKNQGHLVAQAARASAAAYNDDKFVSLKSRPIREQVGNEARSILAQQKTVISFSASIPKYGNMPAGIVTYEQDQTGHGKVTLAYHGTECNADLITDIIALKQSGKEIGIDGYVHRGFLSRYMQSREAVNRVLTSVLQSHGKTASEVDFLVTGHSLGGALATLAAADLKKNFASESQVDLVTFSSPRTVDHAGAKSIQNTLEDRALRLWRDRDPISMVSLGTQVGFGFFTGFKHVGQDFKFAAAQKAISMDNHALNLYTDDAESPEAVKILKHVGWRTWVSKKVSKLASKIKKPFKFLSKKKSKKSLL